MSTEQKRERIKILKSAKASENGFKVLSFEPDGGEQGDGVYEVAANVAKALVDEQGAAERTGLAKVGDKIKEAVTGKDKDKGKDKEKDEPKA